MGKRRIWAGQGYGQGCTTLSGIRRYYLSEISADVGKTRIWAGRGYGQAVDMAARCVLAKGYRPAPAFGGHSASARPPAHSRLRPACGWRPCFRILIQNGMRLTQHADPRGWIGFAGNLVCAFRGLVLFRVCTRSCCVQDALWHTLCTVARAMHCSTRHAV